MPDKEKYLEIIDKVRKTFGTLHDMFLETPLVPIRQPSGLALAELKDLPAADITDASERVQLDPAGYIEKSRARGDKSQVTPAELSEPLSEALQNYLQNIMTVYEYVCLAGFDMEGKSLKVPHDKVFMPPSLMDKRLGAIHPDRDDGFYGGAAALSVASVLQRYRRAVIIGSAGCGKTSLLIGLLLAYTRSLGGERYSHASQAAKNITPVSKQRLVAAEENHLPILVSLRQLGQYLKEKYPRSVKDGPERLLNFLQDSILGSENFFDAYLVSGKAIVLMDGFDEVADARLHKRVARLIEAFVRSFPNCRYIVTSRPEVYESAALLGEQFGTLEIREFNPTEARQFARAFSITVETCLAGTETPETLGQAKQHSAKLTSAIDGSSHAAELAVSPQALSLLALLQRQGRRWPERRTDLCEKALDALLDIKLAALRSGSAQSPHGLDRAESRKALEMVAFWLQQQNRCEFSRADLSVLLKPWYLERHNGDEAFADQAVKAFLLLADEDSGLFVERQIGFLSFSQRVFQEVLAANALAERRDTLAYMRKCMPSVWWREVILFESGLLGAQTGHRVSELIRSILDTGPKYGMQIQQSLFLAADCLVELDLKLLESGLIDEVRKSLKKLANLPGAEADRQGVLNRVIAENALASLQPGPALGRFWKPPFGEPEWVKIPAGEFWMGEADHDGNLVHPIFLPEYQISRVPVTNAQYALYLSETAAEAPEHWRGRRAPRGRENHPVVNVSWHEALAFCIWLGEKTNQPVSLPSEAEWEKAARGSQDQREYPWGNWNELRANTSELALGDTTPVGLFSNGASPFGLLDMTGNVREWTRSLADFGYPYDPSDKAREDLQAPDDQPRILRGGSYYFTHTYARCAYRQHYYPDFKFYNFGFRLVISPEFA